MPMIPKHILDAVDERMAEAGHAHLNSLSDVSDAEPDARRTGMLKITSDSHLDHGLGPDHIAWLLDRFADKTGFFIETVELPDDLPPIACGLHGPAVGDEPVPEDEVSYAVRGGRPGASRMCSRLPRLTRTISVIAGPHAADPLVLYTAFGGPVAPREPFDPGLMTEQAKAESRDFWAEHALSR